MGFTHLELLPVHEHPFDGSWGYQPTGLYAPTSRFGTPEDFRAFTDAAHAAGLNVILDWVPAHFPSDAHGLAEFDGTAPVRARRPARGLSPGLEHADLQLRPRRGAQLPRQQRAVLDRALRHRRPARGCGGLDALPRLQPQGRASGCPTEFGGRENLEAIDFLRRMNHLVGTQRPEAITLAEESTAFPGVSRPPAPDLQGGGLGFHYKWNMGWMNDVLAYMARDPVHRQHHHDQIRFSLVYAFSENFVLPLSHDEVVHGKGSLLAKMPGDDWQKFANLRLLYGFMWGHPGKKLLFMGCEFAPWTEWNADAACPGSCSSTPRTPACSAWCATSTACCAAIRRCTSRTPRRGLRWISHDDAAHSVLVFERRARDGRGVVVVCNFTPVVREGWRIGVPAAGTWRELINTDDAVYGGSGVLCRP
jgi:1,4-alpha-glucan branching enzyme